MAVHLRSTILTIVGRTPALGTILRIDVESGVKPYAIPATNPFTQIDGYRDEIWAYGLRKFDKHTGDLYIPDVGNITQVEVNYQQAASAGGENYGVSPKAASVSNSGVVPRANPVLSIGLQRRRPISPVAEYNHSQGCAVVGGAVYRGPRPLLQGVFLYADFCRGKIWGLRGSSQDKWQSPLLITSVPVSAIGEDQDGNVYVIGYQDGVISMITEE